MKEGSKHVRKDWTEAAGRERASKLGEGTGFIYSGGKDRDMKEIGEL